jgi:hypothetical protein
MMIRQKTKTRKITVCRRGVPKNKKAEKSLKTAQNKRFKWLNII